MSSEEEMTTTPVEEPKEQPKGSAGAELVVPVAGVLFTLYYFSTILDSPWTAQVSAFFIGTVLMVLSLMLVVRVALALRAGRTHFNFHRLIEPVVFLRKRILLLLLTVTYISVIQWTGFTLTTFVFLSLGMMLLNEGRNKRLILVLSAIMSLGGWALFIYAFKVRFPTGPFEQLMKGIM